MFRDLKQRYGTRFLTLVILFILGVQFVVGLQPKQRFWPFVPYRMYHPVREDGQRLAHMFNTYGVLEDGSRVQLKPEDLNMVYWTYRKNIERGISTGNPKKMAPATRWLCAETDGALVRIELEDLGIAISRDGPVYGLEPIVVASQVVTCPQE